MSHVRLHSTRLHLVCCVSSLRSMRNELISNNRQENLSLFSNFSFYNMVVRVLSASFFLTFGVICFK